MFLLAGLLLMLLLLLHTFTYAPTFYRDMGGGGHVMSTSTFWVEGGARNVG